MNVQEQLVSDAESAMVAGDWTRASNLIETLLIDHQDEACIEMIVPSFVVGGLNDRIRQWNDAVDSK